jgi:lipopolysaccharide/colanic/teichoic acid biosynthesis glycosyltransferase/GGDEF domain-containing protein
MARLRFMITLLTLWLIFIFNIERSDALGIDLPTAVYVASAFAIVSVLIVPETIATRWYVLLFPLLIGYAIYRYDALANEDLPALIELLVDWVVISIAFVIGRWLSSIVTGIERTYDALVENDDNLRIASGVDGETIINQELFRARRYDRPVSVLYIKTPSLKQLERLYENYLPYQVSLQHRYLRSRIAQLTETLLYATDPIAWYGDDIVVCLPETDKKQAYELAGRIAKVLHFSLSLDVPIGVALFPVEGLIFADLVEKAFDDLQYYTSEQVVGDDTSPIPVVAVDDDDDPTDAGEVHYDTAAFSQTSPYKPEETPKVLHIRLFNALRDNLRQWYHTVEYEGDLIPPEEIIMEGAIEGKIFYNPNFWVNRLPPQSGMSRTVYKYIKRVMDLTLILMASPLLIIIFTVVPLAIWLEDRGPIFFGHGRTGEGARRFRMYKFRSMVPNADKRMEEFGVMVNERGDTVDKSNNKPVKDPRVTRVGAILRKTSLDELPQLWNVLRGDMSLVGPRPTGFTQEKYTSFQKHRLSVKPGLTGLSQVYDRGNNDFDTRLIWDIKYIDKMSLWLDIQIILRTFLIQVLKRKGA